MSPEVCLHFAAVFLNYFLRVIAGYLACWMLNRLLRKPRQRFLVWMIFLLGSGTYWLGIVLREARVFSASATGAATTGTLTASATHSLLVPLAWSHAIVIVVQIVGLAYLATAMGMIVMEAWRHVRMRVLLKWAVEPSDALNRLFQEICHDLRISRAQLVILPGLKSPATAGWWTPRILLPEVCEEIGPTTQVADVLCHELIHVERRDYLWAGVSDLIAASCSFTPRSGAPENGWDCRENWRATWLCLRHGRAIGPITPTALLTSSGFGCCRKDSRLGSILPRPQRWACAFEPF